MTAETSSPSAIPFRAETRQLLEILIHSLYTEREVFLRELISNASDALTRVQFEMLTRRDVLDPEAELGIWITANPDERTITLRDTGVGMTHDELKDNLGIIAHSGARAFLKAAQEKNASTSEIIGQFGVGFYSAFMVAEWIRVNSRSFATDAQAYTWNSTGEDSYTLEPGDQTERGTTIILKLKEDAAEFAQESRLKEIIRRHSDFIPYPIYVGESKERVNQQIALWRQSTREVTAEKYDEFYRQFTLDFQPPLAHAHLVVDAPVQLYALLFVPSTAERTMFSARKEDGLKLYARKVLIQEYSRDLLPEYYRFVVGVVDSEDLQLNVSREAIQSNRLIAQIRRVLTNRVTDTLKKLAADTPDKYTEFWLAFGRFLKEGIAMDRDNQESLAGLLRFRSLQFPDQWRSLDEITAAAGDRKKIYYLMGDEERALAHSPHLDPFRKANVDVLWMADPLDPFMLMSLKTYKDVEIVNAAVEQPELPAEDTPAAESDEPALPADTLALLLTRFREVLGDRVAEVRITDRLTDSPARLIDQEGGMGEEVQRVYRMLNKEFEKPARVLEINPRSPLLKRVGDLLNDPTSSLPPLVIEQVYEDCLLIEGQHPDPAEMVARIQELMKAALR